MEPRCTDMIHFWVPARGRGPALVATFFVAQPVLVKKDAYSCESWVAADRAHCVPVRVCPRGWGERARVEQIHLQVQQSQGVERDQDLVEIIPILSANMQPKINVSPHLCSSSMSGRRASASLSAACWTKNMFWLKRVARLQLVDCTVVAW